MTNTNYSTLTAFFNDSEKTVVVGDYVTTFGFSEVEDGGNGVYRVIAVDESLDNDTVAINGIQFTCKKVKLELCFDNATVRVNQFGAKKVDGNQSYTSTEIANFASINKNAIQAAINSGARKVEFSTGTYYVAEDICIDHPVDICGNGAKLVLETSSTSTQLFRIEYAGNVVVSPASIRNMKIEGTRVVSATIDNTFNYYNILVNIVNAKQFTISDIYFEYGSSAIETTNSTLITDIDIVNCVFKGFSVGIVFCDVKGFKIKNCTIDLLDENGGTGILMNSNVKSGIVEDVTVVNAFDSAVDCWNGEWGQNTNGIMIKDATDRVIFKNLNIEKCLYGIKINFSDVPICVTNAMVTDVTFGVFMESAKNVSIMHSSILLLPPAKAPDYAVPIYISGHVQAEFKHVQFDFPWDFQYSGICSEEVTDVRFIDCTLQKTDIDGISGVSNPKGFGYIGTGYVGESKYVMTFDACEFRSYIKNYATIATENEIEIITYNFPITLLTLSETDSKLIIKNCRFVNDSTCTVPYFKLDDAWKFDNIVVYNCFFENYNYTDPDNVSDFPIFGKFTNNGISCDVSDHNIFARCNMRSSAPDRTNGTTINEVLEYI